MKVNNTQTNIYNRNIKQNIKAKTTNIAFGANPSSFWRKLNQQLEYSGVSMPVLVLGIVSFGAILLPRLIKARDNTERAEIIQRDVITILVMMMGSFSIRNIMSALSAKKSGYALLAGNHKQNAFFKMFNLFNPIGSTNILSSSQLVSKYSKIDDYKEGFYGFAKFLNENGGNAKKFFSSDKKLKDMVSNLYKKYKPQKGAADFEKASKIDVAEMFNNINKSNDKATALKDLTSLFEKPDNNFVKKAKFMNSLFDFLSTFLFVPLLLGVALPKLNEKTVKKMVQEEQNTLNNSSNRQALSVKA